MKHIIPVLFIISLLFSNSCSGSQIQTCPDGLSQYHKVSLYFGMTYPGGVVTEENWKNFIDKTVTPYFPEGITIIDTYGQWLSPDRGIDKEPGKVIIHLYKDETGKEPKIKAIINEFKRRFHSDSVLWEDQVVCVSF